MTWNDRWETKLVLGGHGTARWNGTEMNNLNQVQSSDAIKRFTRL